MPTALELTPEELRRYRETLRRKPPEPALTAAEQLEREAVLHRVAEAATLLKTQFGARRIVLFGSLAHNAWFVSDSDVDLAVEGLNRSLPSSETWHRDLLQMMKSDVADVRPALIDADSADAEEY